MSDRLEGPDEKVKRAEGHIKELEVVSSIFLKGGGYSVYTDFESKPGRRIDRVRVSQRTSPQAACVLGDALHNLRSALDLLAWQAVDVGPGKAGPTDKTGFPISESREKFEGGGVRKVKGASDEVVQVIRAAEPYKGGNDFLWKLHHLDRIEKHQLLTVVGAAFHSLSLDMTGHLRDMPEFSAFEPMRISFNPADTMFPLNDGDALFETDADSKEDPQVTLHIAFGQGQFAESEPILETVVQMLDSVKGVLEGCRPFIR